MSEPLVTPTLECIKFPDPRQTVTVKAGETKIVYYFPISGGYVAFIEKIACDWKEDIYYEFIVDGVLIEKVERLIAMHNPESYGNFPIVCKNFIQWVCTNNTDEDLTLSVLCDGLLCKKTGA